MVESSDLQSAIARTQAAERIQQLQNQQEEMNRKRFELEMARQRAEKGKKIQDAQRAESKRVVRDQYDRGRGRPDAEDRSAEEREPGEDGDAPPEGGLDVRV
jgi:hypothetical protein